MIKFIKKIVFSFLLCFIFSINAKALVCDNIKVNGDLFQRSCGPWSVPVYVCDIDKAPWHTVCGPYGFASPGDAEDSCKRTVYVGGVSDGKFSTAGGYQTFPSCKESEVVAQATCDQKCTCLCSGCSAYDDKQHCTAPYSYQCDCSRHEVIEDCGAPYSEIEQKAAEWEASHTSLSMTGISCGSGSCDIKYGLKWKYRECTAAVTVKKITEPCENDFTIAGKEAFCINPSNNFPDTTNEVKVDVTQCESSNSTVDCGFGNILIEGYYRRNVLGNSNYTYQVIRLAMQMWGGHTGQAGYNDTGINYFDKNWKDLYLMPRPDGSGYANVFKESSIFTVLAKHLLRSISSGKSIYDINSFGGSESGFTAKDCSLEDPGGMGVVCKDSVTPYIYAFYLYANTIQGNPNMIKHLDEINGLKASETSSDNAPTNISTAVTEDGNVQITYQLQKGVTLDCDTNKNINKEACKTTQKVTIHTINGDEIKDLTAYDYCKKNFCYATIDTKSTIVCDVAKKQFVRIEAEISERCGAGSVRKYVSCGNTEKDQIMFTFEKDSKCNTAGNDKEIKTIEEELICDSCDDQPKSETIAECKKDGSISKQKASDPSLNCILHKNASSSNITNNKAYYDYSEYFKVNTNICKVYCSDEVEYYLAGKKTVLLGLQLKYDIESQAFTGRTKKNENPLTSIVISKRTCASEIFYDKINFDYIKDWAKAYDLPSGTSLSNWKQLYSAIASKSASQNYRTEILNELLYDLYNCNMYSDSEIEQLTDNKVKKPKNSTNALETAKNNLKTESAKIIKESTSNIKYNGGTEYITAQKSNKTVGSNGIDPVLSDNTSKGPLEINVKYCSANDCFRGKMSGKYDEDYSAAGSSKFETATDQSFNGVKYPSNDYALFTFEVEVDFYNSSVYQTEPYTGKVQLKDDTNDKYSVLDKYVYPVSLLAKSICKNGKCEVNHSFNIKLFERKNDEDLLTAELKKANKYKCYFTVNSDKNDDNGRTSYGFAYKNIDLKNPFPSNRTLSGSNWDTDNAKKVIEEITQSGNNNLYATTDYLEYSYVLDSNLINNIRIYNQTKNTYTDNSLTDCKLVGDKYFNCSSSFLEDLNNELYGPIGSQSKTDGISKYNEDKKSFGGAN